jgi:hypothetical protein
VTKHDRRPQVDLLTVDSEGAAPLPWAEVEAHVADARFYWLASMHPAGRPHVRPVLAVWVGAALYTTTSPAARKGRNLEGNPNCSVSFIDEDMHVVVEGSAARVTEGATLNSVANAYRSKYKWPVTVVDGAFDAPYGAPTAGPPPYQPYKIAPATVFAFAVGDAVAGRTTRWRF